MKLNIRDIEYDNVTLQVTKYSNGGLCIMLMTEEGEVLAVVTKWLRGTSSLKDNQAFVDTNNFPGVLKFIEEYGLGKPLGVTVQSGFCTYPAIDFNMHKLKEYTS